MAKKKTKASKNEKLLNNLEFQFDEVMSHLRELVKKKQLKIKQERVVLELKYSINSASSKLFPNIPSDQMPW